MRGTPMVPMQACRVLPPTTALALHAHDLRILGVLLGASPPQVKLCFEASSNTGRMPETRQAAAVTVATDAAECMKEFELRMNIGWVVATGYSAARAVRPWVSVRE